MSTFNGRIFIREKGTKTSIKGEKMSERYNILVAIYQRIISPFPYYPTFRERRANTDQLQVVRM